MTILKSYQYTYPSGSEPNRTIDFVREDDNSLHVRVRTLSEPPRELSSVPVYRISVEMETTSEKTASLHRAYSLREPPLLRVTTMDDMSITEQNAVCQRIRPNFQDGPGYRIEITNDYGGAGGYEKIVQLNLFDPS
ncbi:MAG: hypothetical protein K1060chlam4_00123 [Candidatus Anoxychlamydiales bacterium]|nr:hypothetical protein [Candidatus Anoxychlamydiales bacterium]